MHNRVVVYEADRYIGWEPGNPELASNGSRWRFDLTPDGPNATLVIATYDCTDSPEKVRDAVDNGNAWWNCPASTDRLIMPLEFS
jgi:hypothetical protein